MALDLEKQIRLSFLPSASSLYKNLPTNFILFIWGETVLWGAVFITQTSDRIQYFTILQDKFQSFNTQDDRRTPGLLAKLFQKFPKWPIRPAGSHFWQAPNFQCELLRVWININRVTLHNNKEYIMFIFYLMVL